MPTEAPLESVLPSHCALHEVLPESLPFFSDAPLAVAFALATSISLL